MQQHCDLQLSAIDTPFVRKHRLVAIPNIAPRKRYRRHSDIRLAIEAGVQSISFLWKQARGESCIY